MKDYEFIENHSLITDVFGRWPSFHDAEVYRIVLDRSQQLETDRFHSSLELVARCWSMTPEVTDGGCFKTEHDSIVHLLFEHISGLELAGFNHQNVLNELRFERSSKAKSDSDFLSVELVYCHGLSGSFSAQKAKVISVTPFE